jgi:preprotein translocase subunit SecA
MIGKALTKLFGTKSDRDIKSIVPYVEKTNQEFDKLQSISDEELRAKTHSIREVIDQRLEGIDKQLADLHQKVEDDPDMDIHEKEQVFNEVDKLEEDRNKMLEEVLLEVLPQAFAVVKETARRFKENGKMVVTATMRDKQLAAKHDHVEIDGEQCYLGTTNGWRVEVRLSGKCFTTMFS